MIDDDEVDAVGEHVDRGFAEIPQAAPLPAHLDIRTRRAEAGERSRQRVVAARVVPGDVLEPRWRRYVLSSDLGGSAAFPPPPRGAERSRVAAARAGQSTRMNS